MRRTHPILALLVLLVLGFSFAVPTEDLSETSYDESEAQPWENVPTGLSWMSEVAATEPERTAQHPPARLRVRPRRMDAHPFSGARVILALVCTLLC